MNPKFLVIVGNFGLKEKEECFVCLCPSGVLSRRDVDLGG